MIALLCQANALVSEASDRTSRRCPPAMTWRRVAWPCISSPPALARRTPTKRPALRLRGDRRTPLVAYAPSLSYAPPKPW